MKILTGEDPFAAGEAMRQHIRSSMANAMRRLEPYFQMQKAHPQTYSRTPKKKPALDGLLEQNASAGVPGMAIS